jgi:hypothetical protein
MGLPIVSEAPAPQSISKIPPLLIVMMLVKAPVPSASKLASSMFTSTPAPTVMLDLLVGMVKLAPAPMLVLLLKMIWPLLTRLPPVMVN